MNETQAKTKIWKYLKKLPVGCLINGHAVAGAVEIHINTVGSVLTRLGQSGFLEKAPGFGWRTTNLLRMTDNVPVNLKRMADTTLGRAPKPRPPRTAVPPKDSSRVPGGHFEGRWADALRSLIRQIVREELGRA